MIFGFLRDAFALTVRQKVWFTFERFDQDGYDYRALDVWANEDLIGRETNVQHGDIVHDEDGDRA